MASFNQTNGNDPQAGVIQGSDGNFYGTTVSGGVSNNGTAFRLNLTNTESVSFGSAFAIPFVASVYTITGSALNLILNYAPALGDVLTVVKSTGGNPISGTFTNLPDGGTITASYSGTPYVLTANYYDGSGYDLTLSYKNSASVTLGNLSTTYDGAPRLATATTNPPGLNVTFRYNGSSMAPTDVGSYTVVGTISDSKYAGSATGTLVISANLFFSQWAAKYSLTGGATGTPQNDGVANLIKYFADINPAQPMSASDKSALPTVGTTTIGGITYLTLTYRQSQTTSGLVGDSANFDRPVDLGDAGGRFSDGAVGTDTATGDPMMQTQVQVPGRRCF